MALNPYNIDTVLDPPAAPRPSTSPYPALSPEDETSLLGRIGGGLLSGVGALGRFLDATFGGRAVRGLLAGHPRELLSPLPFSDSLHLTNPEDFTTGRQLLEKAGVVGAPEPGLEWGDVAGFGVDVALNPLTYINPLGTLTPAGRLWARTSPSTMPRGLAGKIRGGEYAAEQVAQLPPVASGALPPGLAIPKQASMIPEEVSQAARAQGLELLPRQTRIALHEADPLPATNLALPPGVGPNAPVPPAPGQPLPYGLEGALEKLEQGQYPASGQYVGMGTTKGYRTLDVNPAQGVTPPTIASSRHAFLDAPGLGNQGTPLAGAFGVKIPFGPQLVFGTGERGAAWADRLDALGGWIRDLPGIRQITKRLHPPLMNRLEPETQALASQFYRPAEQKALQGVRGTTYDLQQEIAPLLGDIPAYEGQRLATRAAENQPGPLTGADYGADLFRRDPQLWAKLDAQGRPAAGVPDTTLAGLQQVGQKIGQYEQELLPQEAALGMPGQGREDYAIRELARLQGGARGAGPGKAKGLSARHASQIPRQELWQDFPGEQTQINDLFRARSLEGEPLYTGAARLSSDVQTQDKVLEELYGHSVRSLLTKPQLDKALAIADELKGAPAERAWAGLFQPDPVHGAGTRGTRFAVGTSGAQTSLEAIRRHGQPLSELAGVDAESIPEFLRHSGLTGTNAQGELVAHKLAAQRLGLESTDELANFGIEKRISGDLLGLTRQDAAHNSYYDKALNAYRAWLYGAWPAAQARNRVWGGVANWLQGVGPREQWQAQGDMLNLLQGTGEVKPLPNLEGLTPGMSQPEIQNLIKRELYSHNAALTQATRSRYTLENSPTVEGIDRLAQTLPQQATGQSTGRNILDWLGGFLHPREGQTWGQAYKPWNAPGIVDDVGPGGGNVVLGQMRKLGSTVEDLNRGTLYLPLRRQGYSPEAAAQLSNQTHFLYNDLTSWERDIGRRAALFPTFSLRNLPMLAENFAQAPAKLNALIQTSAGGLRSPEDFVPPYLAESTAIPLGGPSEEGQQRYLSGFGFGYEDEAVRALGSLLGGHPGRAAGNIAGQLTPLAKLPLELATGTQLHTGRKLEDLRAGTTATALSAFNEDQAHGVAQLLANSPASRAVTTLDQLLDTRKGLLPKASNVLTGLKFTDVDLARQKEIAARHLIEESLQGKPGFGQYERIYVKPEKVGSLNPDEFLLMSLYTQLERQAQAAAKARKLQAGPVPGVPLP